MFCILSVHQIPSKNSLIDAERLSRLSNCITSQLSLIRHSSDWLQNGLQSIALHLKVDPAQEPYSLEVQVSFKHQALTSGEDLSKIIDQYINLSDARDFYDIKIVPDSDSAVRDLQWVSCIGEVLKCERSHQVHGRDYYLSYPFAPNRNNSMDLLCKLFSRLTERSLLSITIEPVLPHNHDPEVLNAVAQKIAQLKLATKYEKDSFLSEALSHYQNYQNNYFRRNVFRYSIKAHTQTTIASQAILRQLLQCATVSSNSPEAGHIEVITEKDHSKQFKEALAATQKQEVSDAIEWYGWKNGLEEKPIRTLSQSRLKPGLGDDSTKMGLSKRRTGPIFDSPSYKAPLGEIPSPSSNELTTSNTSDLAFRQTNHSFHSAQMRDLKPLHRLVTLEEIGGFFRIPIPVNGTIPGMASALTLDLPPRSCSAEDLVNNHRDLITPDAYIVGVDSSGNPVTSDWSNVPNRLVAGVPGAGKSNFLNWIIFQFLLANPTGTCYISDFKGIDFRHLTQLNRAIKIVDSVEGCEELLNKIEQNEFSQRQEMMQEYGAVNIQELREELQVEGRTISRMLWIIDEAADIADAPNKLRTQVENCLKKYARKGRSFGIHVLYCTQRPTTEVITKQVTDQFEERVVFRVSADASFRILGNESAVNQATGQCILGGRDGQVKVFTPLISLPRGKRKPLSETLWTHVHQGDSQTI